MCGFIGKIDAAAGIPANSRTSGTPTHPIASGACRGVAEATDSKDLFSALPWLKRRGPDSQNVWFSQDRRVGIMHARLAIVDKDPRANQPFSDPESGLTVVFAGEIYNFQELKNKFSSFRFRTDSDTEIIVTVFKEYGITGLNLLKGMFSLAIIDERNKKIFLARDSVGKKPLYLARWQDNVFFGV